VTTVVCDLGAPDADATLVDALATQGYAALRGHGVDNRVVAEMRDASFEFFDLPREEKARCEWIGTGVWRRWQPVFEGGDRFVDDSNVEWREWLEENLCPSAGGPDHPLNNWPPTPRRLRPAWEAYHAAMFALAASIVGRLAAELGIDPGVLGAWQDDQYSNLVANHYPAQLVAPKAGQVRVAPHRVVNPPLGAGEAGRRLSLVYFHHPDLETVVAPAVDGPRPQAPIRARDWIEQRQGRYQRDGISDLLG